MSFTIPEHITTPLMTCLTVSIYSLLAMTAVDKLAFLLNNLTIAVVATEWTSAPVILAYILFFALSAFTVQKLLMLAFFKEYLEDDVSRRAYVSHHITMPCGTKIRHVKFVNEFEFGLLQKIKAALAMSDAKNEESTASEGEEGQQQQQRSKAESHGKCPAECQAEC